jgi:hypothetical protein
LLPLLFPDIFLLVQGFIGYAVPGFTFIKRLLVFCAGGTLGMNFFRESLTEGPVALSPFERQNAFRSVAFGDSANVNPDRKPIQSRLDFTIFEDSTGAGIVISPNPRNIYIRSMAIPQADLDFGRKEDPE